MKKLSKKEVRESLEHWQTVLKLTNWTIEFAVISEENMLEEILENQPEGGWSQSDLEESASAFLVWVRQDEQCAKILFHEDMKDDVEYGSVYNLDTVCIHELLHIMLNEQFGLFPKHIRTHKKVHLFEEWICNRFSRIIYDFGESGVIDSESYNNK